VRGAFEFQGQNVQQLQDLTKSLWPAIKEQIITDVKSMKMGSPEDFSNFVTAIHEGSFDKLASFISKKMLMLKSSLEETTTNQLDTLLSQQ
jgi:1-pyrroline-5-carboxylate dehydrogenase